VGEENGRHDFVMAIPESSETPRTLELRKIVEETGTEQVLGWPKATDEDFTLFGRIIHFYSAFDFVLRYMAETMDKHGMFEAQWAGKVQKLTMADVSKAIQSSPVWSEPNKFALEQIEAHRRVRNLAAHFIVRRFPNDDAYIFMTKSATDFKRVYGEVPASIDTMLYGVADAQQLRDIVLELEGLLKWAAQVLADLSKPIDTSS
jgi:hypothetical protein